MKVLFIGGTGRLSTDVAKLSLEKGNEVYLLTRGSKIRKKFINKSYNMIYGDIRNKSQCKKILSDKYFDVIIDFLTFNVKQLSDTLDIIDNHYKQYIFISTATVYDVSDKILSEDSQIGNTKWNYSYEKYECEKDLEKYFCNKTDVYYTIVRPYVTYNETRIPYPIIPENNLFEYSIVHRIINNKSIPVINDGSIMTTITHTSDFAIGVVGLFNNKRAYNDAFHITSDETVTWGAVIDIIKNYYNSKTKKINFTIDDFSKKYKAYTNILNGDKGRNMQFNNDKIKSAVPTFKCKTTLKDGVEMTLKFFEKNEDYRNIDYYWYGKIDRICKDSKEKKFPSFRDKLNYLSGYYKSINLLVKVLRKIGIGK